MRRESGVGQVARVSMEKRRILNVGMWEGTNCRRMTRTFVAMVCKCFHFATYKLYDFSHFLTGQAYELYFPCV